MEKYHCVAFGRSAAQARAKRRIGVSSPSAQPSGSPLAASPPARMRISSKPAGEVVSSKAKPSAASLVTGTGGLKMSGSSA